MSDFWRDVAREAVAFLIPILAAWLIGELTGLVSRLRAWLEAKKHADLSAAVGTANEMLQAAMENAAGQMALSVRQGDLDPTNLASVRKWASAAEASIKAKLPDAIQTVQPVPGALADGVAGKLSDKLAPLTTAVVAPVAVPASPTPPTDNMPPDGTFQARAAIVVGRLMKDLALTREQASGIVGNLGQESGLRAINEIRPVSGRGGFGWGQWTGPRRLAFEAWCKTNGFNVTDDEANYGFLLEELRTTESAALVALRATTTLDEATQVFEEKYERAGVVSLARRQMFAEQALAA